MGSTKCNQSDNAGSQLPTISSVPAFQKLKFVTIASPVDMQSKVQRKAIRSHVAQAHHAANSKEKIKRAALDREYKRRKARKNQVLLDLDVIDTSHLSAAFDPLFANGYNDHIPMFDDLNLPSHLLEELDTYSESAETMGALVLSDRMLGGGHIDPFQTYPLPYEPFIPRLVHHYLSHMAVNVPELDLGLPGLLRESWFRFVLADPTTFHATILLAASSYVSVNGRTSDVPDLAHLKQRAVQAVRSDLQNYERLDTDHLVSAIVKLACHEAIYGTYSLYEIHMKAVAMLLSRRGGLNSLGLNGLLKRMCLWVESNVAFLHNSPRQFFVGEALIPPNPLHFIGPEWRRTWSDRSLSPDYQSD